MALIVNSYGGNPQTPSVVAETYNPDQLIAGDQKLVAQPIMLSGSAPLPRGTVLGQQTDFSVTTTAGTNAGNGTVGSIGVTSTVLVGPYVLLATSATNFTVTDPEGVVLTPATVGTAYSAEGLQFTIAAGGTPFAAGDSFTLTVQDSIGNFVVSVKTASDGSQNPSAILVDYASPTTGNPVNAGGYFMGEFNSNAINYDSSWTVPALAAALRPFGIFLKGSIVAAPPVGQQGNVPIVNVT